MSRTSKGRVEKARANKEDIVKASPSRRAERLETFEARIGKSGAQASQIPAPVKNPQDPSPEPKARKSTQDISVPREQVNGAALRFALKVSDIFWITAIIMFSVWGSYVGMNNRAVLAPVALGLFGAAVFTGLLLISGAHRFHPAEDYAAHQKKIFFAAFGALGVWLSAALMLKPETFLPDALALSGLLAAGALFILHTLYFFQIRRLHEKRALAPTIVMLGATESARRLIEQNAKTRELNIVAIFDDRLSRAPIDIYGVPVVGKVDDLLAWDALPYVNRIVVTLPGMAQSRKEVFAEKVRKLPNRVAFVVDEFENLDHVQQRLSQIADVSMQDLSGRPRTGKQSAVKRLMDVSISAIALILLAPVLAVIALLIKLDSPGPVLFKQERHGFNNRVFEVYKFRSLRTEQEDKLAAKQVTAGDSRVTKVGRIIRKTSLDELPQLMNVIKGDMSLVGPRPHAIGMRTGDVESYKLVEEYAHRHKMKPGMTGWAQINGSRGPLHDAASVARRVELDVEYIERQTAWFDLVIMAKTIPCLLGDSENIR